MANNNLLYIKWGFSTGEKKGAFILSGKVLSLCAIGGTASPVLGTMSGTAQLNQKEALWLGFICLLLVC